MIDQIISVLASWIVEIISAAGYLGVVFLMAIESACIPLPSEVIMPFAGYLVSVGQFSLIGAATAGALGCNVGSTIAYYVAAKGGRPALERWGEYVLVGRPSSNGPTFSLSAMASRRCSSAGCFRWCGPSSPFPPGWRGCRC